MVKIIVLLIAIVASIFECWAISLDSVFLNILVGLLLVIGNIIVQIALFFLVMLLIGLPINTKKENTHYSSFYRKVLTFAIRICLSLFGVKIKSEGLDKIPQNTNFVIVFNHLSNLDTLVMDVCLTEYPLVFVAKKSLFKIPFFGKMLHAIGYIKMDRGNIRQELKAIYKGIDFLNKNECSVGVAPEGTRNFTEETLLPFKVGCLHLATETKKPIVISVVKGTNLVKKNLLFARHKVYFKILDVLDYEEYQNMTRQEIASFIRNKMLEELESHEN